MSEPFEYLISMKATLSVPYVTSNSVRDGDPRGVANAARNLHFAGL